jgi:hypothetical protein
LIFLVCYESDRSSAAELNLLIILLCTGCRGLRLEKKLNVKELESHLDSLDLDEGVRIDDSKKKMFINKTNADEFVLQIKVENGNEDIYYCESASKVMRMVNATFNGKYSISIY